MAVLSTKLFQNFFPKTLGLQQSFSRFADRAVPAGNGRLGLYRTEISGLDKLHAFLKYGNHVTRFSFPYIDLPKAHPGFIERKMDDFLPSPPPVTESEPPAEFKLVPGEHNEQQASLEFGDSQV